MRKRRVMTDDESLIYAALVEARSVIISTDMSDDEECDKRKKEVIAKLKVHMEKLLYA